MICDFGCEQAATHTFKNGKNCCSKVTSSCSAKKASNNKAKLVSLDWSSLQIEYDTGLSIGELALNHNVTVGEIRSGIRRQLLVMRNKADAANMAISRGKDYSSRSDASKEAHSNRARANIISRYETGWMPKSGGCTKYEYTSNSAGTVKVDGTWELKVASWLDAQNFSWKRNTKRFQYVNLEGGISFYTPDFWVDGLNSYIEVKGYETAKDRCKWSQFTEPLQVWKKEELVARGIL